jgi:hypothetical protein
MVVLLVICILTELTEVRRDRIQRLVFNRKVFMAQAR